MEIYVISNCGMKWNIYSQLCDTISRFVILIRY